jgi:hypothetical protein
VTDFEFGQGYVYKEKNKVWWAVWIPMSEPGTGRNIIDVRVVMKASKATSEAALEALCESLLTSQQATGIITSSLQSIPSGELAKLKGLYRGADFSRAQVLEVGRAFPSSSGVFSLVGGGALLLLIGIGSGAGWLIVQGRAQHMV